jgi:hypothetical protein
MGAVTGYAASLANDNAVPLPGLLDTKLCFNIARKNLFLIMFPLDFARN